MILKRTKLITVVFIALFIIAFVALSVGHHHAISERDHAECLACHTVNHVVPVIPTALVAAAALFVITFIEPYSAEYFYDSFLQAFDLRAPPSIA